jgi:DnaJ family protein C protein 2
LSFSEELNKMIEEEKKKQMEVFQKQSSGEGSQGKGKLWSEAEIQTLIKGVNLFPAGTKERFVFVLNMILF